ncbi:LysR substrate-binding domain-containing protein [Collimonas sp. OK412]|jgi:DNA-binding transcriptional LysR family regulator|uniref:LysR substrate-binding domain-containing protein n=1 Tax=Collimonas sp. (strain OK412) TaxID=1801619 RepID=UPI0008F3B170|nr:LysR substrate-binding domain-containing protein [Collimonas sp. OK412]SFB84406.1 DNA-binding transcriptional regulator, LysR family [Collimonas sp. OK412]
MNPLAIDLNDLYLFAQVVERHGFTAAGDALGIPKSRISRRISQLEARLGTRLLQRTSRRMSLTEAGQELYRHCAAMIAEAHAGEDAVRKRLDEPVGTVRVSLPMAIADIALPRLLPRFMQQFPKVRLMVQASNRQIDLIEENIDVVVRGIGAQLESSSLVQSSLCSVHWVLVASPQYLTLNGPIDELPALAAADALYYAPLSDGDIAWRLLGPGDTQHQAAIGKLRLQSDNLSILMQAALAGMGVATLPRYACSAELAAGTLQTVLPEWRPKAGNLVVLFPSRRGLAPAVRAFVDFLKNELPAALA